MTRALPVVALALALLIAPGPRAPEAQSSQKVTFALNWFAVGDHAAYWVALDRGYYTTKGLDVEMQTAKVPALAERRVNAVADYTTGMPFYEKAMGKGNAVMMPWSDHGFDMYSMSIIASEKTMKERAGMLRAFLEASYMGWRDVMENPKSALEIFKKRVPEIDLSIIEPNMMMGLELMKTERYAKNGIGWMDDKKMCASVELVNTYMGVPRPVDCKEVYTNEFLTKIELPKSMR